MQPRTRHIIIAIVFGLVLLVIASLAGRGLLSSPANTGCRTRHDVYDRRRDVVPDRHGDNRADAREAIRGRLSAGRRHVPDWGRGRLSESANRR